MRKNFENYFVQALHDAKIQELIDHYSQSGFIPQREVRVGNQEFDLLLSNSDTDQTIVFEIKVLPLNRKELDKIEQLREKTEELGYEFRLVTVSRPTEYKIEIDWFEDAVCDFIANYEQPDDIEEKATHVRYEEVNDIEIQSIEINDTNATVRATGSISVELQYGSDSDLAKDIGLTTSDSFPFEGEFELDLIHKSIKEASIDIDDSHWYE